ncbi:WhiB family transcriptional regulator [Bifidobacterium lemurum]|uniref:WhiB family transcriptional regulator n=1 Tax=Bifidobacterium lemurum TaxID=1603886 RepID=A0A261FTP2_9BIFI|nr:WhiB family transcriptional regulator [Bifidobacterium lemurum]OZG62560.1 WhiB family transcriptional regulator [Bifidobacterium lemurum]QOL33892.1 WhiB family transcriptional regulator [Bifidobacterium lemurum]
MSGIEGGVCSGLPLQIQDLMWGPDSIRDVGGQRAMKKTAVLLCDMCPMQYECLATGILSREQHGVAGGMPLKGRRQLRRCAEADGARIGDDDPAPRSALVVWLREHPELVREIRARMNSRRGRQNRAEDQAAWRARHEAAGGD